MISTSEKGGIGIRALLKPLLRLAVPTALTTLLIAGNTYGATTFVSLQITTQLSGIQVLLTQIGPDLAAALFILAGIFYAIGQIMPPEKKATFHTTAVNLIMGAVVLAALTFAATGLSQASAHLLTNATTNSLTSNT